MGEGPAKVAIIGGGCAGMTTAFELTRPHLKGAYDVTVYQMGWRLGGKGASGRGPADRIEEHGLHLWMGFYENAFRLMRECYEELDRDPEKCRLARWTDAFAPDNFCGVMDRAPDGTWSPWTVNFPPLEGLPGDTDLIHRRWSVGEYLQRSITLVRTLIEAVQGRSGANETAPNPVGSAPGELRDLMTRLMQYGGLATAGGLIQGLRILDEVVRLMPRVPRDLILQFHAAIAASARSQVQKMTQGNNELRRLWEIIDLALAVIHGIIRDGLTFDPKGFDAIDHYDCREWLMKHGAAKESTDSAFVRALYDLAFAYEDGDVSKPRIAAGQALRGAVRAFFTYRGAFFWKMQGGMGDVVFTPFYEVLKKRGVKFEFFHRLQNVGMAEPDTPGGRPYVKQLNFDVQAKIRGGKEYQPLIDVRGLPCWPSEPGWTQLVGGARMKREGWAFESHWDTRKVDTRELEVTKDFDLVVLAVGVGAVPLVCKEIIARDPRWAQWAREAKSVPTQALQVWLKEDIHELGWQAPSINISGFVEPFDTWADMPQLIAEESFTRPVKAVAYFCSVLPDATSEREAARRDYPQRRRDEVRRNAIQFLNRDVKEFWPNAIKRKGGFRWDLLVGPERRVPRTATQSRIDSQFLSVNVNPTDRYSLSLPGTLRLRISPLDQTYDNLTVAGDWTDCGFNEGCVEAAVMSGRLAAHALCQSPPLEEIVGFDHP